MGTATWPPEVAHIPPGVQHSTQHTKPNRWVKGQGLFQFKIKASFLRRNTPHLPLPPRSSESKLPRPSRMNSPRGSPLSPERPPFLAGRADTASPGQGLPSLTEPTRQVPGLAPPTLRTCQQEDSWRWEGCRARTQVAGMGQELAREPQDGHTHSPQSDAERGEAGRRAPWPRQQPPPHPRDQRPNTAARSGDRPPSGTAELNSHVESAVINVNPPLGASVYHTGLPR